jgi:hypothetical protein
MMGFLGSAFAGIKKCGRAALSGNTNSTGLVSDCGASSSSEDHCAFPVSDEF